MAARPMYWRQKIRTSCCGAMLVVGDLMIEKASGSGGERMLSSVPVGRRDKALPARNIFQKNHHESIDAVKQCFSKIENPAHLYVLLLHSCIKCGISCVTRPSAVFHCFNQISLPPHFYFQIILKVATFLCLSHLSNRATVLSTRLV